MPLKDLFCFLILSVSLCLCLILFPCLCFSLLDAIKLLFLLCLFLAFPSNYLTQFLKQPGAGWGWVGDLPVPSTFAHVHVKCAGEI